MWLFVFFGVILAYFIWKTLLKPLNYFKEKGIEYIPGVPVFGNYIDVALKRRHITEVTQELYMDNYKKGKRYIGTFQMQGPQLMILDIELIKQISIKNFDHFVDHKVFVDENVEPIFGKSLFNMKGESWREMRSTLSPVFTSSKIRNMTKLMVSVTNGLLTSIEKDDKKEFNLRNMFSKVANDVIATTAFGIETNSMEDGKSNRFYESGLSLTAFGTKQTMKMFGINTWPAIFKFFNISIFDQDHINYFHEIVQETIREREKKGIVRPDLIHLLMQAKKGQLKHESENDSSAGFATVEESDLGKSEKFKKTEWTDMDLTAQSLIFFFAGFETVTSVTSFVAYELAVNKDVQEKLQQEIDEVLASNEQVDYDLIVKMKYLDQVIAETLRLWSPGFQTDRLCTKDFTIKAEKPGEKDIVLEAGSNIMIPIGGIQNNPDYFPNPKKFDPERFNDENKGNIISGTYLPFGIGPRNCIGSRFALIEMKVLIFALLSKYDMVPTKDTQIPFKLDPGQFNMQPKITLAFKPRNL